VYKGILRRIASFLDHAAWTGTHIAILAVSGAIALSLPWLAERFLAYWARVDGEESALLAAELVVGFVVILLLSCVQRGLRDRKLANVARDAGLARCFAGRSPRARKEIRTLKESHGLGRAVMLIGSTGCGTFVDPEGDLHSVVRNCLEAKIMLANPCSEEIGVRLKAILHPNFSPEPFQDEVRASIAFLRRLRATGKTIKLKIYSDAPLVKLAVLGDYIWLQHYHVGLDVQAMPEYVFQHERKDHGLYALWHQYFVERWESGEIPEYDFDTDELIYSGGDAFELRREPFMEELEACTGRANS
jgi:hypothetical protein